MRESDRMLHVQAPIIPAVAEMIARTPGTISLGQGVVYYGPPPQAIERIGTFLENRRNNQYSYVTGIPDLVDAITAKLAVENGIALEQGSRVLVTAGGNMAFMNAILAIADPGDEIILPTPYYFNHEMAVTMASCKPVLVATDDSYQLRPDAIRRAVTARTRAVVTVSPNNPTGAVYSAEALRDINGICRDNSIYHISDEAYEYFTYAGARPFSAGSLPGSQSHTISLFSLSKAYGFASWRIGYMVVPSHLVAAVEKIQDTILICPPLISQFAAVGALSAGRAYCEERLRALAAVRSMVLDELSSISEYCEVPRVEGAFYLFLRVRTRLDPMSLVERLIREHGVALIPGTAFGCDEGCSLRLAYGALERETVAIGIGRLVNGLRVIVGG
jgi:aspartate/methionine/tyrosine aminotransferase